MTDIRNRDLILFSEIYGVERKGYRFLTADIGLKAPFVGINNIHSNFTLFNLPHRFYYHFDTCLSKNNENDCSKTSIV